MNGLGVDGSRKGSPAGPPWGSSLRPAAGSSGGKGPRPQGGNGSGQGRASGPFPVSYPPSPPRRDRRWLERAPRAGPGRHAGPGEPGSGPWAWRGGHERHGMESAKAGGGEPQSAHEPPKEAGAIPAPAARNGGPGSQWRLRSSRRPRGVTCPAGPSAWAWRCGSLRGRCPPPRAPRRGRRRRRAGRVPPPGAAGCGAGSG